MDKPALVIYNVKNAEILWKYGGIRYLTELREIDEPKFDEFYDIIKVDSKMTIFDRFVSSNRKYKDKFVYLSSSTGLEFQQGTALSLYNMYISKNKFYINDSEIINGHQGMILEYNPVLDKLVMSDVTTKNIWELYGGIYTCDNFISNDNNCNTLYSVNQMAIMKEPVFYDFKGDSTLEYRSSTMDKKVSLDLKKYVKTTDPIYAITLANNGNIELNNGKYKLHEEYFKTEDYYYLYEKNGNLIIKSNRGEYKWAANKKISNRSYDANAIYSGDSFEEGEMLYCGDYSMTILEGKLFYRDHKTKTETEIVLSNNPDNYLKSITLNENSIIFYSKEGRVIDYRMSTKSDSKSVLKCGNNRSIVWNSGDGIALWSYPKLSTTTSSTINQKPSSSVITSSITNYITEPITQTITSVTTTKKYIRSTYTNVSYQGKICSKYYLGVNNLKEFVTIQAKYGGTKNKPMKYTKWLISSENKPSYMYLANNDGGLSNYCLNVGQSRDNKSYYLSFSKCSQTSYLFKYNVSFTDYENKKISGKTNIAVYKNSNTLFTNGKGIPYCIYYTDTLRIEECKDTEGYENFDWTKYKNGYYTKTSTKYETVTSTSYITTSTVKPVVTTTLITSYLNPTFTPTKTNNITPTESKNSPSISVKFKGILSGDSSIYLSVPKLETNVSFNMLDTDKYYTWFVTSKKEPSYLYLQDGVSGNVGKPTNNCLDLGDYVNNETDNYNYLRIVKCSDAKYKFKYDT